MSVIVLIKDKDRFVVGCDDRVFDNIYTDDYYAMPKAKHMDINNEIIIGCCGNGILLEFLQKKLNQVSKINRNIISYEIIPSLIEATKNTPCIDLNGCMAGELIIAYKDKAYSIYNNFVIQEIKDSYALGSGKEVALGSLYTSKKLNISPEERIAISITAAGNYINTVSKNAYIGDTAGKNFKKYQAETLNKMKNKQK